MKYIKDLKEGDRVFDIYLCKHRQAAVTKNGKPYENVVLQDKTGTIDAKVWEPNNPGIGDYDALDYIEVYGEVNSFQGVLQVSVKRIRVCKEGEYDPGEYLPVSSKNVNDMYQELMELIGSIEDPYLKKLLEAFFVEDQEFAKAFKNSSAAKTVHHGFVGGLLEHTLSVTKLCDYYCGAYPILKRDLLLTAAMCHDIGKTKEISPFPQNDYTDDGQLLGHIVMGSQMVAERAALIQMTWPGAPTIYYGDEAGLCGFTDPDNRRTYPWGRENHELIEFHRSLIHIHKNNEALRTGSLKPLAAEYGVIAYGRFVGENILVVALNNNDSEKTIKIPVWEVGVEDGDEMERLMLTDENGYNVGRLCFEAQDGMIQLQLGAYSSILLRRCAEY